MEGGAALPMNAVFPVLAQGAALGSRGLHLDGQATRRHVANHRHAQGVKGRKMGIRDNKGSPGEGLMSGGQGIVLASMVLVKDQTRG